MKIVGMTFLFGAGSQFLFVRLNLHLGTVHSSVEQTVATSAPVSLSALANLISSARARPRTPCLQTRHVHADLRSRDRALR